MFGYVRVKNMGVLHSDRTPPGAFLLPTPLHLSATATKAGAAAQPSEKIIISNLPVDVNEAQIRVSQSVSKISSSFYLTVDYRSCSPPLSALFGTLRSISIPKASPRASLGFNSRVRETAPRRINNTTIASLTEVSIHYFHYIFPPAPLFA